MVQICPQLLSQGGCTSVNCDLQHDVHLCPPCRVVCITAKDLQYHMTGQKHKTNLRVNAHPEPSFCNVCNITSLSPLNYQQHIRGRAHQKHLKEREDASNTITAQIPPAGYRKCDICNYIVRNSSWSKHTQDNKHKRKQRFVTIQAALDEADKDKHGVTVSHGGENGVDFGLINTDKKPIENSKTLDVTITLMTLEEIDILEVRLSSSMTYRPRKSSFSLAKVSLPGHLDPLVPFLLRVTFDSSSLPGRFHDRLEVVFLHKHLKTRFVISRSIQALVGSKGDMDLIKPSAPYKPKPKSRNGPASEQEVVKGIKPPALADISWVLPLPQSAIPKPLEVVLFNPSVKEVVGALQTAWLPRVLDAKSYGQHFSTLLHVEEVTMNIDIQRYDDHDVPLEPLPSLYFRLPVPGLAEKRPSLIVGDRILVQNKGSPPSGRWFEGFVHRVRQNDVDLKFHPSFDSYKGQRYNVRFKLGRLPLRRMHQALLTAFNPDRVLFPRAEHVQGRRVLTEKQIQSIRVVNRSIKENRPQLLAVTAILHMPPGSIPFVVFGPPGTGKTVTIVEAMRQILLADPDSRILACAPSNSAADLIAERLSLNLTVSELFRLNAPSRNRDQLPTNLLRFSQSNTEGTFSVPPLRSLEQFRVIVSTCLSSSVPYGIGMQRGHFTHIFIDEAGQACEPEAMIPIKTMANNKTNIVLSGDPKQLGPIIRSAVAIDLGLGKSYLDRLMERDVYNSSNDHGISVVKLIKNWRSHPVILKYPNDQFYKGELEPCGDVVVTHSLLRSEVLVKAGFPIVFHAITGKDMQEANSPSFFNVHEASLAKKYVEELRADSRLRLKDENIGLIAPYHAQVMKIRTLLKKSYPKTKVGSVEEFQGQERRVIIISTVRSSIEFVDYDVRHTLGFVANPRRFNVAITRAQALLIVIGDPSILSLDPLWRGFLNYVYSGGGWKGKEPDWDTDEPINVEGGYDAARRHTAEAEMDQLIERTKKLIFVTGETAAEEGQDARMDLPWREAS